MKIFPRLTALLAGLLFSLQSPAWNAPIHMAAVELALEQLPSQQRWAINDVAYNLVVEQESDRRLYLMRNFPETSWLAQISLIPDMDRNVLLDDFYAAYGLEVPQVLARERARNTAHWHYINTPFVNTGSDSQCPVDDPVNLVSVLPLLIQSYGEADSGLEKAVLLAFIAHLVVDAHQPLHAVSRVDENCRHDRGGNDFCVSSRSVTQRCQQNLHELWDGALGLFAAEDRVASMARRLNLREPNQMLARVTDPRVWVDEARDLALVVYALSENRRPDPIYIQEGQAIAAERLILAGHRLANILRSIQ